MQAIVDLVAEYWARTDEGLIVSCLKGMFSALTALYAGNIISRKLRPPDPFVTPEWDMSYLESIGCQNCVNEWEESCASLLRKNRTRD